MKKTYICPQTDIIMTQVEQFILAGSDVDVIGDTIFETPASGDTDVLSRDIFDIWAN